MFPKIRRLASKKSPSAAASAALLSALLLTTAIRAQPANGDRNLTAYDLTSQPNTVLLDGALSDLAWTKAAKGSDFTQREPDDGLPATERTEFQIAFDDTTLYIAIRAFDSDATSLVAMEMERDAELHQDDSVAIVLDTFFDRRNAYSFETNPNCTRTDVLISDEGRDLNRQWDGVWRVACRRDEQGWTAEFAIPFSTLRFDPQAQTWGLNVRRMIRRKNEEVNWTPLSRSVGSVRDQTNYAAYRISLAGTLDGLDTPGGSRQLAIKPYALAKATDREGGSSDEELELGLDVKWGVTRSLNLDLTYNTDFAEVEVDEQQVNLTRFSLFFPEKREFFLENAGIFEFGLRSRSSSDPALMKLFFSRRIGLDGGEVVPIIGGARLTGRVGGWNVGVLDVVTDSQQLEDGSIIERTNFGVLRAKRNIGRRSGIGIIAIDRDASGPSNNQTVGIDVDWKPTNETDFAAYVAKVDDDSFEGDDWSAGYQFGYQNRTLEASFEHQIVNEAFVPQSGFLLRGDYERLNPRAIWRPRIDRYGLQTWYFEANVDYFERASTGDVESRTTSLSALGFRSNKNDGWGLNWVEERERLFEPFEIADGIVIPAGLYTWSGWRLGGRTNGGRRLALSGRIQTGDFFEGERTAAGLTLSARLSKNFRAETSFNTADVELPQGDFSTQIIGQKLNFSFTPDLRLNAFVQYNDRAELVAANLRFNWIYRPGADLFVVYNHNWNAPSFDARQTRDRQVIIKFTYLFQP